MLNKLFPEMNNHRSPEVRPCEMASVRDAGKFSLTRRLPVRPSAWHVIKWRTLIAAKCKPRGINVDTGNRVVYLDETGGNA